ncbi:MAG: small basic protein [Planctomycetota bacterium]|nr:MAG: small basic protein [Planctomycetota bacterium]
MSLHRSLKVAASLVRARNVLKRGERIEKLEEQGRWSEEKDSIFGLPKTRVLVAKKAGKKKKKKKDDEGDKKKK